MSAVTVVGAGRMGSAMARRLALAGHEVTVWNRSPGKADALAEIEGIRARTSTANAVSGADVVICSLSTGAATETVLLDPEEAYEVFENSSIAAPHVLYKQAAFLGESTPVAMSLDLVSKDLGLIADAAMHAGLETPALDGVRTDVSRACEGGQGADDMSAVLHHVLPTEDAGPVDRAGSLTISSGLDPMRLRA